MIPRRLYWWLPGTPLSARDYKYCATCGVRGCVCEYCDDCDAVVNPYEHFTEWDPDGGAHLSDAAVRSLTTAREAEPGGKEL